MSRYRREVRHRDADDVLEQEENKDVRSELNVTPSHFFNEVFSPHEGEQELELKSIHIQLK